MFLMLVSFFFFFFLKFTFFCCTARSIAAHISLQIFGLFEFTDAQKIIDFEKLLPCCFYRETLGIPGRSFIFPQHFFYAETIYMSKITVRGNQMSKIEKNTGPCYLWTRRHVKKQLHLDFFFKGKPCIFKVFFQRKT